MSQNFHIRGKVRALMSFTEVASRQDTAAIVAKGMFVEGDDQSSKMHSSKKNEYFLEV